MDIITNEKQIEVILFSCNRASQAHTCLASFYDKFICLDPKVTVLWKATTDEFKKGYLKTQKIFLGKKNLIWQEEEDFYSQLTNTIQNSTANFIMFLVDDDIFVNTVSIDDKQFEFLDKNQSMIAVSLRLHKGVTHCYATNKNSSVPNFVKNIVWAWAGKEGDWGYPMSVDGNVYKTDIMKNIASVIRYKNPNTFESMLEAVSKQNGFPQYLCCYTEGPRLINIPVNIVQTQYNNRFTGELSTEQINTKYLSGQTIDYKSYSGIQATSVHVPVELKFIEEK